MEHRNLFHECPACGHQLPVSAALVGKNARCPGCGTVQVVSADAGPTAPPPEAYGFASEPEPSPPIPAGFRAVEPPVAAEPPASVAPVSPAEGEATCPKCDSPMVAVAVVCIQCGFNRKTGKQLKTVSKRIDRHWDTNGFPYWGRAALFIAVAGLCASSFWAFEEDPGIASGIVGVGVPFWALLLGTLHRVRILRRSDGQAVVIKRWFFCFLPLPAATFDLKGYRTIRLQHKPANFSDVAVVLFFLPLLLFGVVPALYVMWRLLDGAYFTLDVTGTRGIDGDYEREPLPIYGGRSEKVLRAIGDTLEEVAGMRYG
jgi:hypothetical protein